MVHAPAPLTSSPTRTRMGDYHQDFVLRCFLSVSAPSRRNDDTAHRPPWGDCQRQGRFCEAFRTVSAPPRRFVLTPDRLTARAEARSPRWAVGAGIHRVCRLPMPNSPYARRPVPWPRCSGPADRCDSGRIVIKGLQLLPCIGASLKNCNVRPRIILDIRGRSPVSPERQCRRRGTAGKPLHTVLLSY